MKNAESNIMQLFGYIRQNIIRKLQKPSFTKLLESTQALIVDQYNAPTFGWTQHTDIKCLEAAILTKFLINHVLMISFKKRNDMSGFIHYTNVLDNDFRNYSMGITGSTTVSEYIATNGYDNIEEYSSKKFSKYVNIFYNYQYPGNFQRVVVTLLDIPDTDTGKTLSATLSIPIIAEIMLTLQSFLERKLT